MSLPLSQFDITPKSYYHVHVWADYLEILCLVSVDQSLSKGDILDRVRTTTDDLSGGGSNDIEENDLEDGEDADHLAPAQINDKWVARVNDWFKHLSYRSYAFSDAYPFTLSISEDVLEVKKSFTIEEKLYIFLLLCANLRYCRSSTSILTRTFERLSADALRSCLADTAEVHVFGTSETGVGHYTGNFWKKITDLAQDLGEKLCVKEDDLPKPNYGDGGLDVVAWVPTGDSNAHRIVVFGQCACTEEWESKQYTATDTKWRQTMTLSAGVSTIVFIPHSLRQADGSWHDKTNIATIMMDRLRFMYLLKDKLSSFESSNSRHIVEQVTAQRETVF